MLANPLPVLAEDKDFDEWRVGDPGDSVVEGMYSGDHARRHRFGEGVDPAPTSDPAILRKRGQRRVRRE